jgi:ribonuclease J
MSGNVSITVHRGTHQIGGCVTEISTPDARVFIDVGADLPSEAQMEPLDIEGLTCGNASKSAVFFTHYHADHVGRIGEIMPDIPMYMGATAKAIQINVVKRTQKYLLPVFGRIETFSALDEIRAGDISITPLMIDHSAFDAYMFVVEACGKRILHTGDFRTHGMRGAKTFKMLSFYARDIDYIICEGTVLSRSPECRMTERELQGEACKSMLNNRYVFALCSSTNIDRIGAFYHANPSGRMFVCDEYQKSQLDLVRGEHAQKSDFYDFRDIFTYAPNLDGHMREGGFCMLVRQGGFFKSVIDRFKDEALLIYSMWAGYLDDEKAKNQSLVDFIAPYRRKILHTSGHSSSKDLAELYRTVNPKEGLIPIHSDAPEAFRTLIPEGNIIILQDKEVLPL